ncbi:MAG: ABA4-like family protein [Henriciella sp.]|mgnify:CR=1 FL=1|nr:ABA4-like family protein [Henriciella sp.]
MTWQTAFSAINFLVLPAWALLVLLPKAKITKTLVHSMLWPVVMGGIYTASLIGALFFGMSHPEAGFTMDGVTALFQHPNGVITGWSHYLVFDLFVGAWIGRDSQRQGIPHWQAVPCILFSFIFGPVGLFLYAMLRLVHGKGFSLIEDK